MSLLNDISHIPIGIASPQKILEWSHGEVTKPETINYKTFKPEKNGLFCERIFGPSKDWHCASNCGQYKRVKHKGKVCEKCGVEVTTSKVRRERMGHIELAAPVVHFWYFRSQKYVSTLLNIPFKKLESIIYCKTHLVVDPGDTDLEVNQLLSGREYEEKLYEFGNRFRAGIGGAVIKELLQAIDLEVLATQLQKEISETKTLKKEKLLSRLKVVDAFRRSGNRPEWVVLDILPVIPPDLRPMVQLDGGRFTTTDLNDLYRRIINRNNRLKRLMDVHAPEIIVRNEVRMLQEAVDALIANHRRTQPVTGPGRRVLKSLSSSLEGKQGRFRQNLLGKRVDYSGRSVITVGPDLNLHQCGIPREMALELFKPFVMHQLVEQNHVRNINQAKEKIESRKDIVWDMLEQVVEGHPVLLNRAPTLHKLSIRAFEPVIIEGEAIKLHPLVCNAFNADFDGDQMAVHIPLSREAQAEARILMLASENLLHPQNGESAVTPSQDMILGCHYLFIEKDKEKGEGKFFGTEKEALIAYELEHITLHSKIILSVKNLPKIKQGKYLVTTIGKLLFNQVAPETMPYFNESKVTTNEIIGLFDTIEEAKAYIPKKPSDSMSKGYLKDLISLAFDHIGSDETAAMLDAMKNVGYKYATRGGITINLYDIQTPLKKVEMIEETEESIRLIEEFYNYGQISEDDRYQAVIRLWGKTSNLVAKESMRELREQPLNPIRMMIDSGARGSEGQYRQLAGMRGLMADPSGKVIERPIKANFQEGLSVFEFFISSHGARKGLADTSLKTADSGYLTRRMVDVAQNMVITEVDCKTEDFMYVSAIQPQIEALDERIVGRYIGHDMLDSSNQVVVKRNTFVTEELAKHIVTQFDEVPIRNLLTCKTSKGVCSKCYGLNLSTRKVVDLGEAVGVIAAQSIGEPGTQLTMRTFHMGGVAGDDITQGLPRVEEIFEARKLEPVSGKKSKTLKATLTAVDGVVEIKELGRLKEIFVTQENGEVEVYIIPYGRSVVVENGESVQKGDVLSNGPINPHELLKLKGLRYVQRYLLEEVQKVYATQGVKINDKHIEIIIRQMSRKVMVKDPGDSKKLVVGRMVDRYDLYELNEKLLKGGKTQVEIFDKLQGITEASMNTDSFLSAASFQETPKALTDAAVRGKKDYIKGLKESVITGKKIPAGTGFSAYLKED